VDKLSVLDLIAFIRMDKYEIRKEFECNCSFDWYIKNGQLHDGCDPDGCWVGNILYVNGKPIAQDIQGESIEALVELTGYEDTVYPKDWDLFAILEDLVPGIINDLCIPDSEDNSAHDERIMDSLIEWLKDSKFDFYVNPERGFANEYTCVLANKGVEVGDDLEDVTAEEWAERYLYRGDPITHAYVYFAYIE